MTNKTPKSGKSAAAYMRTSSATNVGEDKDSHKRQKAAIRAYARANGIKYFASNCPKPPRRHSASPKLSQPSNRQLSADSSTGTGCQLCECSLAGVL